jgi:hypothetical protein
MLAYVDASVWTDFQNLKSIRSIWIDLSLAS